MVMKILKTPTDYMFFGFLGICLLFLLWLDVNSASWWFIWITSFEIDYSITSAFYISILFFIISIVLYLAQIWLQDFKKRLLYAKIIFMLWLLSFPIFYLLSPWFLFYHSPNFITYFWFFREDRVMNYLEWFDKYCIIRSSNKFSYKWYSRTTYCKIKWKHIFELKSVDEYIMAFDYANEHSLRKLYEITYLRAYYGWYLERIIKEYKDDTFQLFLFSQSIESLYMDVLEINAYGYIQDYIKLKNSLIDQMSESLSELDNNEITEIWNNFYRNIIDSIPEGKANIKILK